MVDHRRAHRGLIRFATTIEVTVIAGAHVTRGGAGEPSVARPSSVVALVRDRQRGSGMEVLMVRRAPASTFAPDALTFPGGIVDSQDALALKGSGRRVGSVVRGIGPEADAKPRPQSLSHAIAAVRELFEECGIFLGTRAGGIGLTRDDGAMLAAAQDELLGGNTFRAVLSRHRLVPGVGALVYAARFVTPLDRPRRFDASFFLARSPEHQQPHFHATEVAAGGWFEPSSLLDRQDIELMPPTRVFCTELARHRSVQEAIAALGRTPLQYVPEGVT